MDQRISNPEASLKVIREVIGAVRRKECGIGQAYALLNVALGMSREDARPILEPTPDEIRPVVTTAERRARLFIDWQLKDTRTKNVNWREALKEVLRVMDGAPVHPDLLVGEGAPLPEDLAPTSAKVP